jgi:hypothetical protein
MLHVCNTCPYVNECEFKTNALIDPAECRLYNDMEDKRAWKLEHSDE